MQYISWNIFFSAFIQSLNIIKKARIEIRAERLLAIYEPENFKPLKGFYHISHRVELHLVLIPLLPQKHAMVIIKRSI